MLTITNARVIYNRVILVLKGLSLEVPEGKIVALLGANGAGKSTTLKAISGLLKSEEGEITDGAIEFLGEKINNRGPEEIVRRGIFQVMEGRRIFEDLTVEENLVVGGHTRRDRAGFRRDKELVYDYFPRLRERRHQLSGYLSGGEQQMLAIGRAFMSGRQLMLLDEPSMGLAPLLMLNVFGALREINREGTAILLVEQNARLALQFAGRGYVLENGKLALEGSSEALQNSPQVKRAYLGG
jgi:branched-chain amino acid transport system ATP-binding protein